MIEELSYEAYKRIGIKLDPCKYCGQVCDTLTAMNDLRVITSDICYVRCDPCGAHGPVEDTPSLAIKAWNRIATTKVECVGDIDMHGLTFEEVVARYPEQAAKRMIDMAQKLAKLERRTPVAEGELLIRCENCTQGLCSCPESFGSQKCRDMAMFPYPIASSKCEKSVGSMCTYYRPIGGGTPKGCDGLNELCDGYT